MHTTPDLQTVGFAVAVVVVLVVVTLPGNCSKWLKIAICTIFAMFSEVVV